MNFKTYLKLLFHAIITSAIILSIPITTCVIAYNHIPDWATVILSLATSVISLYAGVCYMFYIVNNNKV